MAVRMRLKRIGAKKKPFYRVVVADARMPRDGRFIETLGTYDPRVGEGSAKIDGEKALRWLRRGAQPTETVRRLLSSAGILQRFAELKAGSTKGG